jgi:hypothetical protein
MLTDEDMTGLTWEYGFDAVFERRCGKGRGALAEGV